MSNFKVTWDEYPVKEWGYHIEEAYSAWFKSTNWPYKSEDSNDEKLLIDMLRRAFISGYCFGNEVFYDK